MQLQLVKYHKSTLQDSLKTFSAMLNIPEHKVLPQASTVGLTQILQTTERNVRHLKLTLKDLLFP